VRLRVREVKLVDEVLALDVDVDQEKIYLRNLSVGSQKRNCGTAVKR
jgi:predicted peptidase